MLIVFEHKDFHLVKISKINMSMDKMMPTNSKETVFRKTSSKVSDSVSVRLLNALDDVSIFVRTLSIIPSRTLQ